MRIEYVGGTRKKVNSGVWAAAGGVPTALPPYTIYGLEVSPAVSDRRTAIAINPGACRDRANSADHVFQASGYTKQCSVTWSAGDGGGALVSSQTFAANKWYHVYLVGSDSNPTNVDFLMTTTASGVTVYPGTFNKCRRIGCVRAFASAAGLKHFMPHRNLMLNPVVTAELSTTGTMWRVTAASKTFTLNMVPPGIEKVALIGYSFGVSNQGNVSSANFAIKQSATDPALAATGEYRGGALMSRSYYNSHYCNTIIPVPMGVGQDVNMTVSRVTGHVQAHVVGFYDVRQD